jgi:hypothetical protein
VQCLLFFSSKCCVFCNANFSGSCVIHILHTGCAKIYMSNSGAKRLMKIRLNCLDNEQSHIHAGTTNSTLLGVGFICFSLHPSNHIENWLNWERFWLVFARCPIPNSIRTPAVLTVACCVFLQSHQGNALTVRELGHNILISYSLQFIIR